jgi:transposase
VVWVDEAGFYLLAGVVRTYAPRGQTPVLRVPLTRDHLSVISGITAAGRLLVRVQARAFKGPDIVRFLKHLRTQLGGKLLVIWDGLPAHADEAVQLFLANAARGQIQVEQLPGYAPDLNPAEGIWDQLKYVELRNVTCHNQAELRHELRRAIARLQHKPDLVRRFIAHSGY